MEKIKEARTKGKIYKCRLCGDDYPSQNKNCNHDFILHEKQVKHTPGPWNISAKDSYVGVRAKAGYLDLIADLSETAKPQNRKANARLIAAAPELLAVCEVMLEYAKGYSDDIDDELLGIIKFMESTINKAKGN